MYRARQYQVRRVVISMMLFVACVGAGLCLHGPVPAAPPSLADDTPVIDSLAPSAGPVADDLRASEVPAGWPWRPDPPPGEREGTDQAREPRVGDMIITQVIALFDVEIAPPIE